MGACVCSRVIDVSGAAPLYRLSPRSKTSSPAAVGGEVADPSKAAG
jgi:hypothetical protein